MCNLWKNTHPPKCKIRCFGKTFLETKTSASYRFHRFLQTSALPNVIWQIIHLWLETATAPDSPESVQSWQHRFVKLQAVIYWLWQNWKDSILKSSFWRKTQGYFCPEWPKAERCLGTDFGAELPVKICSDQPPPPSPRFGAVRQVYLNTHDAYPLLTLSSTYIQYIYSLMQATHWHGNFSFATLLQCYSATLHGYMNAEDSGTADSSGWWLPTAWSAHDWRSIDSMTFSWEVIINQHLVLHFRGMVIALSLTLWLEDLKYWPAKL